VHQCLSGRRECAQLRRPGLQGKYAEGLEIHRQRNPFVLACGRVCPAFCEQRCRRGELDQPIGIRQIKRFMADQELKTPWTPPQLEPKKGRKVAIIGSGPAGLTAALRLAQWGYDVVVHEALPVAGGMMVMGIPEFRLPKDILNAEIENIKRAGVEIALNSKLGRDFSLDDLFHRDGCAAVILAMGPEQPIVAHPRRGPAGRLGRHGVPARGRLGQNTRPERETGGGGGRREYRH